MRLRIYARLTRALNTATRHFILLGFCIMPLPSMAGIVAAQERTLGTGSHFPKYTADNLVTQSPSEHLELSREQAMWTAIAFENTEKLASLLKQGADPNKAEELSQMTPLMAAETLPIAKVLIDAGADPCLRDRAGRTPLHHAAKMREGAAIIELLVRKGADVNARANDATQSTPLLAAIENYLEVQDRQEASLIIRVLVHLGADINIADARGNTALVLAATVQSARADLAAA